MSEGTKHSVRWRPVALSAVVVVIVTVVAAWALLPGRGADPHDYLREPDDVVYGDGSLATVLAHYGVSLPGQATDVHFHDEESPIGSGGTLYLHLRVRDAGLTSFLQALDLGPLTAGLPASWDVGGEGRRFGWSFPGSSWRGAQGPMGGTVADTVVVARSGGVDTVYVIAERF